MKPVNRRPVGLDGHLVLLHASERQRRSGVAAWVRRGLDVGAKVVHVARDENPHWLQRGLERRGVDVTDAVGEGRLRVLAGDAETTSPSWRADVVEQALAEGFPSVRWSGQCGAAAASRSSAHTHAVWEWAMEELCHMHPVSAMCEYPADLPEAVMRSVCAVHGAGLRQPLLKTSAVPGGLALAGEADVSNEMILRAALAGALARTGPRSGSFALDLSGLGFLDVSGARALLTGTVAHRLNSGTVLLRAAQAPVARVLRLLRLDRTVGFRLEAA